MKFIVDAHLPKALAFLLREKVYDAVHTTELPGGNDTTDAEINRLSLAENRIVISKDADFYDSYTAKNSLTNCSTSKPETSETRN
jgi:predicted nuclease of predicted toxin-antitoxin system